jgi:hypothetical protein
MTPACHYGLPRRFPGQDSRSMGENSTFSEMMKGLSDDLSIFIALKNRKL